MREFVEGEVVSICNRGGEFFRMMIHRRVNPRMKYIVLETAKSPCPSCTGHIQHVRICTKAYPKGVTDSWFSGAWFDSTGIHPPGNCTCDWDRYEGNEV